MLKKEFKKHDVERLRNLIKGKSSSRTSQGVGYTKSSSEDHEEGDVWKENGRTWTIKDGITENITISANQFRDQTLAVYKLNEETCRHYILIKDQSGNDKNHYKKTLSAIEDRFYKYEDK